MDGKLRVKIDQKSPGNVDLLIDLFACILAEAMDKITASKKAAARLREAIMGGKRPPAESPAKETPQAGTSKPFSSKQPGAKARKYTAGSTSGSSRKQSADKQPISPLFGVKSTQVPKDTRPPRGGQQEPDLVQVAKSMVRVVSQEERDAVRGVGTLDLDGIMGLLSETLLRVHGLRRPINAKNQEAQATSTIRTELEAANKKNQELEATVKTLQDELRPLRQKMVNYEEMEKALANVKERLSKQEKDLTEKLSAKAETEKMEIAQAMVEDSAHIMRMTWSCLFPKANYASWEKKFRTCTEEYNRRIMQEAADEDEARQSSEEEEVVVALEPLEEAASKTPAPEGESSKKGASKNQAPYVEANQASVETRVPPNV